MLYTDEFEDDDLIYFTEDKGLTVNIEAKRLLLFEKTPEGWVDSTYELQELRRVQEHVPDTVEYYSTQTPGGVAGIGHSIGIALRNTLEARKAKMTSGVVLNLRDVEMPRFFIAVPDSQTRASLMEAFRQILEDGAMETSLGTLPMGVAKAYER
jgi:hypothetical protein